MKNLSFLIFILFYFSSFSQVGINVETPNQMLDVDGKIKIGTDGKTPTEGTMAYIASQGDFWGYTNEGYKSLTQKNGPLPTNPVPITGYSPNINAGFIYYCTLYTWDGTSYATVPTGKKFIITGLYPTAAASAASSANEYYILEFMADLSGTPVNYSRIRISGYDNEARDFSGHASPLIVLNEGERLRAYGVPGSTLAMNVAIRGFMVDDLDYD
ncbi:MAG: hypothetical protein HKN68_23075 [Saprospiraceae bacterium]|nr:hypothetical protein [Saprospiraceae bacterium]